MAWLNQTRFIAADIIIGHQLLDLWRNLFVVLDETRFSETFRKSISMSNMSVSRICLFNTVGHIKWGQCGIDTSILNKPPPLYSNMYSKGFKAATNPIISRKAKRTKILFLSMIVSIWSVICLEVKNLNSFWHVFWVSINEINKWTFYD